MASNNTNMKGETMTSNETKYGNQLNADGSVTTWDIYVQGSRTITSLSDKLSATLNDEERQEILGHFFHHGEGVARCKCGTYMTDHNLAGEAVQFCSVECRDK